LPQNTGVWLIERQSLTELSVICAIAEEWETRLAGHVAQPRLIGTCHERSKQLY